VRTRASSLLLGPRQPSRLVGVVVALLGVAAITLLILPLRHVTPVIATGVLYLVVVLLVSTVWGLWLGLATSVASALAFNYFHIPPTGRLTIAHTENLVALVVFFVAAVVASSLADLVRARTEQAELRRREADLTAELARVVLGAPTLEEALPSAGRRLAQSLDLRSAGIELGTVEPGDSRAAFPLVQDEDRVGTLVAALPLSDDLHDRIEHRVVPALSALLAAGLERERLQAEVLETQALRRSDEIKTAVLRSVSHDLRTPLTAIGTAAEALSAPTLGTVDREQLAGAVTAEVTRLTALVDKLLDLSKLQSGFARPRTDWVSVEELVTGAIAAQPQGPGAFRVSIKGDVPLIRGDAVQLERALANLLENAVRYSAPEPVLVRVRRMGERIMIRVVDRGPGLAYGEHERVFEPFYRGPATGAGDTGSGLGLAIVKGFVEANGGRVWAESLPGQGTTFVVELPVEPVATPIEARSQ
jgi:two-component system, OmpR family, sensor histidine kinase KdpD